MKSDLSSVRREKQRWDYIDVAKGIGMLAVILGHMGLNNWNIFCFSFHMPLFFIISGLVFHKQDGHSFIKKRARQLLIPYLFTCGCIIVLAVLREIVLVVLRGGEFLSSIQKAVVRWGISGLLGSGSRTDYLWIDFGYFIGAIWFLLAMFWAGLLVNTLLNYQYGGIIIIFLGVIGVISAQYIWLPCSIQPATVAAVFILIGYELKKQTGYLEDGRVIICCFGVWIIYLCMCYIANSRISIVSARLPMWILDIIGSTAATICVIWLSTIICRMTKVSKSFLEWFGRNSIVVLCFHLMELSLFPWWLVEKYMCNVGVSMLLVQVVIYIAKVIWASMAVVLVHNVKVLRCVFSVQ